MQQLSQNEIKEVSGGVNNNFIGDWIVCSIVAYPILVIISAGTQSSAPLLLGLGVLTIPIAIAIGINEFTKE